MPILNTIVTWLMKKRLHQIELFKKYPVEVQQEWLRRLLESARDTEWGRKYKYASISRPEEFRQRVPVQDYDTLKGEIERIRRGEQNILWPTEIKWFAKSSGTTSDKSKFIPISQESMEECHFAGGKDMVAIYCNNNPDTELFTGKNLALGGSYNEDLYGQYKSYNGDLSAIVMQNLPFWAEFLRAPELSIALMNKWEDKLEKIASSTMNEKVTSIAGVPSWMLVLLKHILKLSGKRNILHVWPNLEVFFHGGVNFLPYRDQFREIFGSADMKYLELYNASEGFFGIQDQPGSDELLLMLDYGIYYEFIPMEEIGKENPEAVSIGDVVPGKNYAVVITTSAGLWRYQIGDTVTFTSTFPFRFRVTGRTKLFINAFGEEVIIDNAEKALSIACEKTASVIREYTAGPVYFGENENGAHEWLIEFEKEPRSIEFFAEVLDNAMKAINSDYEAKRYHNMTLRMPFVKSVKKGTFYNWLKKKDKLGGQYKVPRLSNDRKILEEILKLGSE